MSTVNYVRRLLVSVGLGTLVALLSISLASAAGVTGPAFYADGQLYRTVGTPTNFSTTGAPDSSYETIYAFGGLQPNVAEAAPGDPGFRGGRWMVRPLIFNTDYQTSVAAYGGSNGVFDSAAEVMAALNDSGPAGATLGPVVKMFECPVIALSQGH
jgi:hypothetical protein